VVVRAAKNIGVLATGGHVVLDGLWVTGAGSYGLAADGAASSIEGARVVVEDTVGGGNQPAGGAWANTGASIRLAQATLRGNAVVNARADDGSTLQLSDSTVELAIPDDSGAFGIGVAAYTGGQLSLTRCAFANNSTYAVDVRGATSHARLERTLLRDTRISRAEALGRGLNIEDGAQVELDTVTLLRNADEALLVRGESPAQQPSTVTGSRLWCADTLARTSGIGGLGVSVNQGARAELNDVLITDSRDVALYVNNVLPPSGRVASATVRRLVVRDTALNRRDGANGNAVVNGGQLALESALLSNSHSSGIMLGSPRCTFTARDVSVRGVLPDRAQSYGHGAIILDHCTATFERSEFLEANIGVVAERSAVQVSGSVVAHNAVAVHVQRGQVLQSLPSLPATPALETLAVSEDTAFIGNTVQVGSGEVPLPFGLLDGGR
jgi:hypothetical protein